MHKILSFIILLFAAVTASPNNTWHYRVLHITSADGLPGNTIRDIKQDKAGFLWMAGTGGVARYDGYRFVPFNHFGNSIALGIPRHIGKLTLSPDTNRLWISTATYNQACYDLGLGRFVDYTGRGDEERPYRRIVETSNGTWMVSNTDGLRHVMIVNGAYVTRDYTVKNHSLASNRVRNVAEDSNGVIWAATDNGITFVDKSGRARTLLRGRSLMRCAAYGDKVMTFQKDNHTAYIFDSKGRLLRRCVLPTAMGHISAIRGILAWQGKWIIFSNRETYALDVNTGTFSKPADYQISNGSEFENIDGVHFVGNQSGSLWIFPKKGNVRRLDLFTNTAKSRDRNTIFRVTRGADGLYYIGSYGSGLFVYDYDSGEISHYTAEDRDPIVFSNYVLYVYTDRSGCIWVTTENGGVSRLTPSEDMAEYYIIDPDKQGDWTNTILNIMPQGNDLSNIRIETRDQNLYDFSLSSLSYHHVAAIEHVISGYVTDNQGHVWTATRGGGLLLDGKEMTVVADNRKIETLDYTAIAKDNRGRIWVGTWGQGLLLVKSVRDGKIRTHAVITNQYNESRINDIATTHDGYVLVATLNGFYVVDAKNGEPKTHLYSVASGNFPSDEVYCVRPGKKPIIWVGTIGGGLVRCDMSKSGEGMTYKTFTTSDGLSNDNIRSLVFDRQGFLWIGTDDGLSRLDPKDNYILRYNLTNHVLSNTFSHKAALLLHDGRMVFGTANGMLMVDPSKGKLVVDSEMLAPPLISDILVNGSSIYEGLDSVVMERSLSDTKKIKFSHSQNSLTFFFSSCNYREISSQIYQYYLEGLDDGWRSVTSENHAEYSNLSPGNYVFHLRLVNPHKNGEETTLKIRIAQPWYNSLLAWVIYIILFIAISYWLWLNAREKFHMHQQVKVQKQVAAFRTEFFTHVTHEFRTPLAILQNAVERIAQPGNPSRKDIQTAQRGLTRLSRLVNQFLEYRRMESGKLRLQVEEDDVIDFAHGIFLDFRNMAEKKHITMNFTPYTKVYKVKFDHTIVESVIYNLLSNAVKYTQNDGVISFTIRHNEQVGKLLFIIEDNGPGIDAAQQANLFQPFMEGHVSKGGMGIGLYTSFNIAKIHHGALAYESVAPHGSRFIFSLPDNNNAYSDDETLAKSAVTLENKDNSRYDEIIREMAPTAINNQLVSIIEDDADMQEQIASEVGVYFLTNVYGTGKEALEGIENRPPSLILCDIMLPDTDGYSIVSKLKEDDRLKDIPIIMLTALDDENHQIKGYKVGVDDYMVKPCNYHLLIARMMQLIKWHEIRVAEKKTVADRPSPDQTVAEPSAPAGSGVLLMSRADKRFKEQVETIVSQHIDDQSLSVDRLAEMMSMGRTKFYGKVKDVFGMSPNKYLLSQRMETAAQLLDDGKYNVSEVSYRVGFSDPAYFNKCFKAHFGMVPSKYRER